MKQIFILEREEMDELKRGEPLKIILGDQTITLQADVIKKAVANKQDRRTRAPGEKTITDQVFDYLEKHGGASAVEISRGMQVSRVAVASALNRFQGVKVKRSGQGMNVVWSIKGSNGANGAHGTHGGSRPRINSNAQVLDYLEMKGDATVGVIAKALNMNLGTVNSALLRMKGDKVRRKGKRRGAAWSSR